MSINLSKEILILKNEETNLNGVAQLARAGGFSRIISMKSLV
jgi:hypothetical protein